MHARWDIRIVLFICAVACAPAVGQASGADPRDHERRAIEAFEAGEYEAAAAAFRAQIELDPRNFVPRYNLSNALAAMGKSNAALAALERSIELGMSDYGRLRTDPALDPLRGLPRFERIVENWDEIVRAQRDARLERNRALVGRGAERVTLDDLRVDVLSAYRPGSTEIGVEQIGLVAAWAESVLGVEPAAAHDAWVVVAMPDQAGFRRWSVASLGVDPAGVAAVGGAYMHDGKRLVTRDLSATLRHEFFHVLHWRDMDRRGQRHPFWIQEGLASLVEDVDRAQGGDGRPIEIAPIEIAPIRVTPSWRTNIVKRNADLNTLLPLEELAGGGRRLFVGSRSLAHYAQARAMLRFLRERGELSRWYRVYTTDSEIGFEADASGLRAIEAVTGLDAGAFDAAFEAWVDGQREVPEELEDLGVSLGIGLSVGAGEGPRVSRMTAAGRRRTGLRPGDVLLTVDGMPVGETQELARRLSALRPGQTVVVRYRRGRLYGETEIELTAGR